MDCVSSHFLVNFSHALYHSVSSKFQFCVASPLSTGEIQPCSRACAQILFTVGYARASSIFAVGGHGSHAAFSRPACFPLCHSHSHASFSVSTYTPLPPLCLTVRRLRTARAAPQRRRLRCAGPCRWVPRGPAATATTATTAAAIAGGRLGRR